MWKGRMRRERERSTWRLKRRKSKEALMLKVEFAYIHVYRIT
jgi:hypothetical protein